MNSLGPSLKMGDGIDEGLSMWALVEHIQIPWYDNTNRVIIKTYENAIRGPASSLAGLDVPFGCIFLVHGPHPKCTTGL